MSKKLSLTPRLLESHVAQGNVRMLVGMTWNTTSVTVVCGTPKVRFDYEVADQFKLKRVLDAKGIEYADYVGCGDWMLRNNKAGRIHPNTPIDWVFGLEK